MTNTDLGPLWDKLDGGLWHTTHPERFLGIIQDKKILPEPKTIPNSERWGTSQGPMLYPFVRTIAGVSLFDFHQFDPDAYQQKYPVSSWRTFIPYRTDWRGSVWIQIDRQLIIKNFISGADLLAKWREVNELGRKIMPILEAAHVGALPLTACTRAFFIRALDETELHEFDLSNFSSERYATLVHEWAADYAAYRDAVNATYQARLRPQ